MHNPLRRLTGQCGRFDAADRAFWSVASAWKCVCTNAADVKELVPEFYGCAVKKASFTSVV